MKSRSGEPQARHGLSVHPERLLILGCSRTKLQQPGLLPALQRYDGPAFRVVRKYLREQPDDGLYILVLSAEFGLISSDLPIPNYDRRMTASRADELRQQVVAALYELPLDSLQNHESATNVLIYLGKDYQPALATGTANRWIRERVASGSQGRKLSILHDWLRGSSSTPVPVSSRTLQSPRIRGVFVHLTAEGVAEEARRGLLEERGKATNVHTWVVEIDGLQISPKWLVSRLTSLPVSSFTTTEARSLLAHLNIEVKRQ